MNSWKINKYGFLNFWLFDDEQIRTGNGNLLLNGENGSGKSVTLQSFIPIILDGNTKSNRISTEGDMSRKIDYYILYPEKKENISYIYAEFVKENNNKKEYITFGIGFKLKRGQSYPKKWFFKLKNQRINGEFNFYSKENGTKIIYDKGKLKNFFEKKAPNDYKMYDTSTEYKNDVNNSLFGFSNIEEYEETLDLILELRKPNLKDASGFDPKYIYEILNRSLKLLPENELMNMSDSFEKMENISEELEEMEVKNKALKNINIKYENYNKMILWEKLNDYLIMEGKYRRNQKSLLENTEKRKFYEEMLKKNRERIEKLVIEKEEKNKKILELQLNNKLSDVQKNYENAKIKLLEYEKNKKELEIKKVEIESKIIENKRNLLEKNEKKDKNIKNIKGIVNEIDKLSKKISFESITNYEEFLSEDKNINIKILKDEFKEYLEKIAQIFNLLENEKVKKQIKENKIIQIEENEEEWTRLKSNYIKSLSDLEQKKEESILKIKNLNKENKVFYLDKNEIDEIEEIFFENEEDFEKEKAIDIIDENKQKESNKCYMEKSKLIEDKKAIKREIEEIINKINLLKKEKDFKIKTEDEFKREREKLDKYIEFYKTVKFRNGIEEKVKNKIEKALLDSGILNAIITEENDEKNIEIYDKILKDESEKKENLYEYLELENGLECEGKVIKILKSISIKKEGSFYITENGEYKLGVLEGIANPNYNSKYIGIEARKRLKEEKIKKYEIEIENLNYEKEKIILSIEENNDKINILRKEYRGIKEIILEKSLEILIGKIKMNIETRGNIRVKIEEIKNELSIIEVEIKKIKIEIEKILRVNRFKIMDFNNLKGKIQIFKTSIEKLEYIYDGFKEGLKDIKIQNKQIAESELELEKTITNRRKEMKRIQEINQHIQMYEEKLQEDEYKDFLKEITELKDRVNEEIPKKTTEYAKKDGQIELNMKNAAKRVIELNELLKKDEKNYYIYKYLLDVELENGFIKIIGRIETVEEKKKLRLKLKNELDEEKTKEQYYNELSGIINIEKGKLQNYHLDFKEYKYDYEKVGLKNTIESNFSFRQVITGVVNGKRNKFMYIFEDNQKRLLRQSELFTKEEEKFFKEFLFNEIGKSINRRIKESEEWVKKIDEIMKETSSKSKKYKLRWKPKMMLENEGMKADQVVKILGNKHSKDAKKIEEYFKKRTKQLKEENKKNHKYENNYQIIKEVLDYRKWYEFKLSVIESDDKEKNLTKKRLNSYSGGEKVMAMYVPLFSALYARFINARKDSLKIVAMDEAFSVVDDENIERLFETLEKLNMNFLLASQKLSGTYKSIKKLAIITIENPVSKRLVKPENGYISLIKYIWNGTKKEKDLRDATQLFKM
ncbi:MAG: TIGR02680 family protein [Fusobacteriia bacterium 4572_132]|nr:MAG: TIGR02680 family protein [Fusobacteriia bacterium 4572_132]